MPRWLKFPTAVKDSEDRYAYGADAHIDADQVIAVEPRLYRYHTFRPEQELAIVHLSTGQTITVFAPSGRVMEKVLEEKA